MSMLKVLGLAVLIGGALLAFTLSDASAQWRGGKGAGQGQMMRLRDGSCAYRATTAQRPGYQRGVPAQARGYGQGMRLRDGSCIYRSTGR
ncbi:MAG: hypothetical protein ACM3ON_02255 [Chloroflexota bacterium]